MIRAVIRAFALLSVAWCLISVYLSRVYSTWEWFGRSGAILALAGAALSGYTVWKTAHAARNDPTWTGTPVVAELGTLARNGQGKPIVKYSDETRSRWRENRMDARAASAGLTLGCIGTLIWGYGDWLLQKFFPLVPR